MPWATSPEAHFNPAVTFGLWLGRRFPGKQVGVYMVAQVVGAIAAAAVLLAIASGVDGFSASDNGLGSNGYGEHSPGGYGLVAGLVAEFVLTLVFVFVIMGATDDRAPKGLAPLAIGLTLALIHLICIPVTGTSVNPARSIGPAIFQGGWALSQIWVFIAAPLVGGAVGRTPLSLAAGEGEGLDGGKPQTSARPGRLPGRGALGAADRAPARMRAPGLS